MTLFNASANHVLATNTFTTAPKHVGPGTQIATTGDFDGPSWCECIVPDKTKVLCSFIYVNGDREQVTVLPAQ